MRQLISSPEDVLKDPHLHVYTWHVIVQGIAAFATLGALLYVMFKGK